ncbi:hypothetical protein ANN_13066 [Periplaneta americana]|uniref:Uncharacterized protein n=1 Tax=Periplaneta americana TaxID=6978 RepID=A0ABQ8TLU5_PERAM|nr:hypothetical protein ANN_13066 [Periplaneta americana]
MSTISVLLLKSTTIKKKKRRLSDNTTIIQAAFQCCKTWKSFESQYNNWSQKLRTTAPARDNKPAGRARTVRTPENIERVRAAVIHNPKRFTH